LRREGAVKSMFLGTMSHELRTSACTASSASRPC
jgi:hypothetical protein